MSKITFIQLYKKNERTIKALLIFSILLTIVGTLNVVFYLFGGKINLFELSIWHNLFLTFQGVTMFFMLKEALNSKKYFFCWDDKKISYYFPKDKQLQSIMIDEISSIKIKENQIEVVLKNQKTNTINLNFVFTPKRTHIKEYFELLSNSL